MLRQLSQTLSHFSLSQSTPPLTSPEYQNACHATPPSHLSPFPAFISPEHASTPRRAPQPRARATPFQPLALSYPATAPLPSKSTLGSPFSSKIARGSYRYRDTTSPSKGIMTEHLGARGMFEELSLEYSEIQEDLEEEEYLGQVERSLDGLAEQHSPMGRNRRDTSGSSSSVDDFSGSGTSTASLPSLGRQSSEYQARHLVTVWPDDNVEDGTVDCYDPSTPSRPPYIRNKSDEEALQMSIKTARASPLMYRRSHSRSPAQGYEAVSHSPLRLSRTPAGKSSLYDDPSPTPAKSSRSAFASLIPRYSCKKKDSTTSRQTSRSPCRPSPLEYEGDDALTDTEDIVTRSTRGNSSQTRVDLMELSLGSGIGLGISRSSEKTTPFSRSFSSESSGEIETSPSKAPTNRPAFLSSGLPATSPNFLPARRSTVAYQTRPAIPVVVKSNTPTIVNTTRNKATRPLLRRGATDPRHNGQAGSTPSQLLNRPAEVYTPINALFGDEKPSPAAFASTGLMKKKSSISPFDLPRFGDSEPALRYHAKPPSPVKSKMAIVSTATSVSSSSATDTSVSVYGRGAQRTRGLRRKGSQMFGASGSSGSIGEMMRGDGVGSPATPTKGPPGTKCE
jgi:mitosis inhibitor protein kinase SWE1